MGADLRINVTGSYTCGGRSGEDLEGTGLARQPGPDDERERRGREERPLAYDTSKAAANHLVRELAVELSPLVRVNGVARRDRRAGQRDVPRATASSVRYCEDSIPYKEDEPTDAREKLAQFYADRTLTKYTNHTRRPGRGVFSLHVSERLSKTTGQVITVDGGLHEAFLRLKYPGNDEPRIP